MLQVTQGAHLVPGIASELLHSRYLSAFISVRGGKRLSRAQWSADELSLLSQVRCA